jgi:MFS family permease
MVLMVWLHTSAVEEAYTALRSCARAGRKRTLLVGDVLFAAGALAMGLATSITLLIAGAASSPSCFCNTAGAAMSLGLAQCSCNQDVPLLYYN